MTPLRWPAEAASALALEAHAHPINALCLVAFLAALVGLWMWPAPGRRP